MFVAVIHLNFEDVEGNSTMKYKQGDQRLKELFSNLEVLIGDLAGNTPELPRPSEGPTSLVVDAENASLISDLVEAPRGSTLPLSDDAPVIPSPRKLEAQIIGERQTAPPPVRQRTTDEQGLADFKDFGIGVVSGTLVTGVILACTSQMDVLNNLGRFAVFGGEVLFGILGAFAAKSLSKTRREIWMGAIEWSLVPVWIGLFIILLLYLLSFTNLFGV
jgi:hypothetical protein